MADQLSQIKQILGSGNQSNIDQEYNSANIGMNLDNTLTQVKKGMLTYALNAAIENFDSNSVNYQNEQGNEFCLSFPKNYPPVVFCFFDSLVWNYLTKKQLYKQKIRRSGFFVRSSVSQGGSLQLKPQIF